MGHQRFCGRGDGGRWKLHWTLSPIFVLQLDSSIHLLVNVAVEPFIADPLVGFWKFQQVAQPHANLLPHTPVRRCMNHWTTGTSLMCICVLRLSGRNWWLMLLYLQCLHFATWCSHGSSFPSWRTLRTTFWWWAWQHCIDNIIIKKEAILLTDTSRLKIICYVTHGEYNIQFATYFWRHISALFLQHTEKCGSNSKGKN